jgi:flagellar hook-associated protein 3 FlgL
MIQGIGTISQEFLANLQVLNQETEATQEQVSSGRTVNQPSDDPAQLGDILQLESDLGKVNQVSQNLGQVTGQVNTAESALESATTLLDQVNTLGEQGANSTMTATQLTGLSQQVEQALSQLVSLSNTQYDGQYVFSGSDTTQPSYQLDLSSPTGVDQLITSPSTYLIQDATGTTFAASQTAQQIFGDQNPDGSPASDNIFAAVNSLRLALANNDQAGITSALGSLQLAQNHLSESLQFYGGVQDQLTNATSVAQMFQLQYQTSLTQETSTNMATAATTLTQEQTTMQASLQAEASIPKTTLFDMMSQGG